MAEKLIVEKIGLKKYSEVWEYQTAIHKNLIDRRDQNLTEKLGHTLILCQHPHVYTLGKSGDESHLLLNEKRLKQIDAEYFKINRGGDITYHGPGQLVVYPILDLNRIFTDVHKYVRLLEECIIRLCKLYKIETTRIKEYTGVWIKPEEGKPRKICAIGVHLSRWVSLHGLAFNVNTNLNYFAFIIPCGIQSSNMEVTSLENELGHPLDIEQIENQFIEIFCELFELEKK